MNKKGFTLVELLAVIVVLGLVITITATKGFGAFDNTKKAITEQNKRAIQESIKLLEVELENCDDETEDFKALDDILSVNSDSCETLISNLKAQTKEINLTSLKEKQFINGTDLEELDGIIVLTFDENGKISDINTDDIAQKK